MVFPDEREYERPERLAHEEETKVERETTATAAEKAAQEEQQREEMYRTKLLEARRRAELIQSKYHEQ